MPILYPPGVSASAATSVVPGILPSVTVVYPPIVYDASGQIAYVSSISALFAALANTANREIVLANGTYNSTSYQNISGSVVPGYIRTPASSVVVRAATDGGVTWNGSGGTLAWWFREGTAYQEWRGFKLGNFYPWDNGVIGFGEGNGVPVHHITLRNIEFLSTVIVGAGPVGTYRNGHAVYFTWANSGGNHDLLIDGMVSNADVAAQVHIYHDEGSGPGYNITVRNAVWNLGRRAHSNFGVQTWTSKASNFLFEDVTINGANERGIDHNYSGTFILRRVTTTNSGSKGFYSTAGTYPSVPGFMFDACSFDSY